MGFTEAEKQVLIAIDWISRRKPPNRDLINEKKRSLFNETLVDWQDGIDDLIGKGAVVEEGDVLSIADDVLGEVSLIAADWLSDGFNETILKSEESRAYSHFCELVYGRDLCQYSMISMEQLNDLLQVLSLGNTNRVIDLGCAIGCIDEYICDTTGAHVTGLDFAAKVVARANERTADKRDRLVFEVQTMDDLSLEAGSFDTVISIDSLYFVRDLGAMLERCRKSCRPPGQFGFFYSQIIGESDSRKLLEPEGTKLAQALQDSGIDYKYREYSEEETRHWRTCREVAEKLKAEFEAEGNSNLYESRARESDLLIEAITKDRVRRYLYYGKL